MTSRVLTILNALGCLALTGLIAFQWLRERDMQSSISAIAKERDSARAEIQKLESRRAALERDVSLLKESLAATQQAAESTATQLSEKSARAQQLQTDLDAARSQTEAWQTGLKERDARIETLHAELTKTRTRLDEAIARLKQVTPQ